MSSMQGNLDVQMLNGVQIELDNRFRDAINLMENSRSNLLITGRAGTGKSTLLEYFRSVTNKNIAILAPTGVAALNVKGQTIHSFFRFKPNITVDTVKRLYSMQRQTYLNIDTIVIDEISMVRADLLDCVDAFMRTNGKDASLPFGGVQMIFVGDLYQLPPVVTKAEEGMFKGPYKSQYFFDSNSFGRLDIQFIELEKHHRQTEEYFIELLNAIRNNVITNEQLDVLNLRLNASFVPDATKMYITLTSTNRVADEINAKELARLETKEHIYTATLGGDFDKKVLPADEVLRVKEGMQVMMLNNDKAERWVNGSVGTVIGINSGMTDYVIKQYKEMRHDVMPSRIVIHKTSSYWDEEKEGFLSAIENIPKKDLITIADTGIKFYRPNEFSVLRGTLISNQDFSRNMLYTTGFVPSLDTYPGLGIPKPLLIKPEVLDSNITDVCREILSFTKLDWNNTFMYRRHPVTLSVSKKVGNVLSDSIAKDQKRLDSHYYFYM